MIVLLLYRGKVLVYRSYTIRYLRVILDQFGKLTFKPFIKKSYSAVNDYLKTKKLNTQNCVLTQKYSQNDSETK